MQQQTVTVTNPSGLHARPGKDFVQLAKTFASEITVGKGENKYPGKSLLKLMQAGISQNDQITIFAEGADEEKALAAMVDYLKNLDD